MDTDHFLEAQAGFNLFGVPLASFSPSRKVAAQSMGMLYPFIGESGQAQYTSTGVYKGAVKDVCILLWLCSLTDRISQSDEEKKRGDWNPDAALMRPDEAMPVAMEWAQGKGILDFQTKEWQVAFSIFTAIVSGMNAAEFQISLEEIKDDGPKEGRDEEGPKV